MTTGCWVVVRCDDTSVCEAAQIDNLCIPPDSLSTDAMSSPMNNYTKPTAMELRQDELHADTSVEEYDHNYIYDVVTLSSDRVELRPLVVSTSILSDVSPLLLASAGLHR